MSSTASRLFRGALPDVPTAVTIGHFDGVHRGHLALLQQVQASAGRAGLASCAVTFDRHPLEVLRPGYRVPYLTTVDDRLDLLADSGIDFSLALRFDEVISKLTAREFAILLREELNMRMLLMGPDNRIGHGGEGTAERMSQLGDELGFAVEIVQKVRIADDPISSTRIREAIAAGELNAAQEMLGRDYLIGGCAPAATSPIEIRVPVNRALPADGPFAAEILVGTNRFLVSGRVGPKTAAGAYQRLHCDFSEFEPGAFEEVAAVHLLATRQGV